MSKHTPGPWFADIRGGCCAVYPAHERGTDLRSEGLNADTCIFYSSQGATYEAGRWSLPTEQIANAELIAQAPAMYERIKELEAKNAKLEAEFLRALCS